MTWKRYRYDGDEEILFLETSEGARVLEKGDTFLVDDQHDLTGRPFTAVGGKVPQNDPPSTDGSGTSTDTATAPVDTTATAPTDPTAQPTVDTSSAQGAGSE